MADVLSLPSHAEVKFKASTHLWTLPRVQEFKTQTTGRHLCYSTFMQKGYTATESTPPLTSLTFRGLPLRLCLLSTSTAFFMLSSILNSTTLWVKKKAGHQKRLCFKQHWSLAQPQQRLLTRIPADVVIVCQALRNTAQGKGRGGEKIKSVKSYMLRIK